MTRSAFVLAATCLSAFGQSLTVKTTVRLVVAPASVSDRRGHPVFGLTSPEFLVLDNGVPRTVNVDHSEPEGGNAVSLVVALQTTDVASAVVAKVRKLGSIVANSVGENGEAAVIAFDSSVEVVQGFTTDEDAIVRAFRKLTPSQRKGGRMLDAISRALALLATRSDRRRKCILIIGDDHDEGSHVHLKALLPQLERLSVIVYGVTSSRYLTPFTAKPEDYRPPNEGLPDYLRILSELKRLSTLNAMNLMTSATGGVRFRFLTNAVLERHLLGIFADLHSRYVLTFPPAPAEAAGFHPLTVAVRGRPDLVVRCRAGYWNDGGPPTPAALDR